MKNPASTKVIQFYRNFREFTGGHLKHWHYFNHVYYSATYLPYIYFGADTVWNPKNPWRHLNGAASHKSAFSQPLKKPDVLFIEGVSDWPVMQAAYTYLSQIPIINLIQHVRHGDPADPRYAFLTQRAIRICVSKAVESALTETHRVNGPLITIPCGVELANLPAPLTNKPIEICIAALKNPELGQRLRQRLERDGHQVVLLAGRMARSHFLNAINQAKITLFLPWQTEGFYLPALEGMALNTLVVCPDCQDNREFCQDGENCWNPAYEGTKILSALNQALAMSDEKRHQMLQQGQQTAKRYSLRAERRAFLNVLENLEQIW
ncbi:MAG: glycosyltransferase [Phormidesmis sp.]